MRVLVTGGREYLDIRRIFAGLDMLHAALPGGITEIIEGGAGGADMRCRWWAEREGVKVTTCKAEWDKHRPADLTKKNPAGAIRNREMIDLQPDLVFVCPGGPGTANMTALAEKREIRRVYLVKMVPEFSGPMVVSFLNLPQDQRPPGYGPTGERLQA